MHQKVTDGCKTTRDDALPSHQTGYHLQQTRSFSTYRNTRFGEAEVDEGREEGMEGGMKEGRKEGREE
jgi:flagellar biosynthesis/type III secretory pathway protein FliH